LFGLSVCAVGPEAGAQQVISGRFYRHEVVGASGLGDITGLLAAGPSINGGARGRRPPPPRS